MQRINQQDGYSIDGACTNGAESYFSRLRRGELGHHHHIAGPYLARYAQEAAWREDLRRSSNGDQVSGVVSLAMRCAPSVDFCGYWQREALGGRTTSAHPPTHIQYAAPHGLAHDRIGNIQPLAS
jgi:hypothetical protein